MIEYSKTAAETGAAPGTGPAASDAPAFPPSEYTLSAGTGAERASYVPYGHIVGEVGTATAVARATKPVVGKFDVTLEFAMGLRVIAPGITMQLMPSINDVQLHFSPPGDVLRMSPGERGRMVLRLIDSALSNPESIEAMKDLRVRGCTPSLPAHRTFLAFAERLSEALGEKIPKSVIPELVRSIRDGTYIDPRQPLAFENEALRITLRSHTPSVLQRLSYDAKALLGMYPKAGKWYDLILERKDANLHPGDPLSKSWLCGFAAKYGIPGGLLVTGMVVTSLAPTFNSMGFVWAGATLGTVGAGLSVLAVTALNRITNRAGRWFAQS